MKTAGKDRLEIIPGRFFRFLLPVLDRLAGMKV